MGRSDELQQTCVVGDRQAIPECPCDWYAEAGRWCADTKIARQSNRAAASGRDAFDLSDGRDVDAFQPIDDAVEFPFVRQGVLARGERGELRDVGTGRERATFALDDKDVDGAIEIDTLARMAERVVRLPGQRVPRFGSVERQRSDCIVDREGG